MTSIEQIEDVLRQLEDNPMDSALIARIGVLLYQLDEMEEACSFLSRSLELNADQPNILQMLSDCYFLLEEYDQAIDTYQELTRRERAKEQLFPLSMERLKREQILDQLIWRAFQDHNVESLESLKILVLGSSEGNWIGRLLQWGALPQHTIGLYLDDDDLMTAKEKLPPSLILSIISPQMLLPYGNHSMDLVLFEEDSACLNQHEREGVFRELERVTDQSGLILCIKRSRTWEYIANSSQWSRAWRGQIQTYGEDSPSTYAYTLTCSVPQKSPQ